MSNSTTGPRCKVGQRAMLILPIHPQNYGKIVVIVGRAGSDTAPGMMPMRYPWNILSLGSPLYAIEAGTLVPGYTMEARCDDRRLMALTDEDQVDAVVLAKPKRKSRKAVQ